MTSLLLFRVEFIYTVIIRPLVNPFEAKPCRIEVYVYSTLIRATQSALEIDGSETF